jgi:toxin-antitoxin system PIN domain toxin
VKLPDTNLLLYAVNRASPRHADALAWWQGLLSGTEEVGLAWTVLLGFVRLSTRAGIFAAPLSAKQALDLVESWLDQPVAFIAHPTERHYAVLRGLIEPLGTAGNLIGDAHLAALAIEHGGEICTADADFARFRGVRWVNPLTS